MVRKKQNQKILSFKKVTTILPFAFFLMREIWHKTSQPRGATHMNRQNLADQDDGECPPRASDLPYSKAGVSLTLHSAQTCCVLFRGSFRGWFSRNIGGYSVLVVVIPTRTRKI